MSQEVSILIKPTVLIIDDSLSDLGLLIEMMSDRHINLYLAFDGKDGIDKAGIIKPDLILLDVRMPILDGFATCRLLKADSNTRHIPIIFLSAANEVSQRVEGLSLGAVDFIGKPFITDEVVARVEIQLSLHRQNIKPIEMIYDDLDGVTNMSERDMIMLTAAMRYLRQSLQTPPTLETLAKAIGCNPKRLNQIFKDGVGMTVFSWLGEERLRQARNLLTNTSTPIASIAEHLGYSNQANFARCFRDRFGCSARELRQELMLLRHQAQQEDVA